jgi:glycosyltransferase involved in cell wall biosynthesis
MKILYVLSQYVSHRRAGRAYCEYLRRHYALADSSYKDHPDADVVILHLDPLDFATIYAKAPALREKYVIAYSVWEADDLPDAYKRSIEHVQEIWTPSAYCQSIFGRYHPAVFRVPHIAERDTSCSADDRRFVRQLIEYDDRCVYYLTIAALGDIRKNLRALIEGFEHQAGRMPQARLIVKARRRDTPPPINDPRILFLCETLTEGQIAALYECADVYVSPHHAEGWGLTLSDALLFGKPTIATGYSGNTEFMHEQNSFLLDWVEDYIREDDVYHLFTPTMRWAYPSQRQLEETLLLLYGVKDDPEVAAIAADKTAAASDISRFSMEAVGRVLSERLNAIARLVVS